MMRLPVTKGVRVLGLILILLAAFGCSIFDTRDPEPPGEGTTPWEPPTVPAIVFTNMKKGLEDLTGVNYEKSLAETFTFVPMIGDVDKLGPEVFEDWTKGVEVDVTQRILEEAAEVSVSFIRPEQILYQVPFATL
ncbi:MAG: hypothetical protein P8181_13665, partial [bacterium]